MTAFSCILVSGLRFLPLQFHFGRIPEYRPSESACATLGPSGPETEILRLRRVRSLRSAQLKHDDFDLHGFWRRAIVRSQETKMARRKYEGLGVPN